MTEIKFSSCDPGLQEIFDAMVEMNLITKTEVPFYDEKRKELGSGSQGSVFKAKMKKDDKEVAVKKIKLENVDNNFAYNLMVEVLAIKNLSMKCSNYVAHYEDVLVSENCDTIFIVTEYLPITLQQWVENGQTIHDRIKVALRLIDAVKCTHKTGIAHRDLKPDNVMIDTANDNKVKLIDFGLACWTECFGKGSSANPYSFDFKTTELVADGEVTTTEQAMGADMFALGWTLYFIFSGGYHATFSGFASLLGNFEVPNKVGNFKVVVESLVKRDPSKRNLDVTRKLLQDMSPPPPPPHYPPLPPPHYSVFKSKTKTKPARVVSSYDDPQVTAAAGIDSSNSAGID